ncbi:proteasome assembly chaperone 2 [Moniliophthora roreri MCA 2997]|uniref:Proteasome assembly chaperone 2 n=1 Tax=Moniliophthora roreri (strain MCA 2997) TaxID=1381753 RepID=V2YY65_MONRO|nr:proteasome assembly chaperone 2 [Moniliophthora roreri MCA 2997]
MPFFNALSDIKLVGKIILIPVVSAANVSQLTADLLIASLGLPRIAVFDSSYGIPLAGSTEDGGGVTTAFELYGQETSELLILQQRSPPLRNKKQEFIDQVFAFVEQAGIAGVLFLSGVDPSNRTDDQMYTPVYQLQVNKGINLGPLSRLSNLPIPTYTSPVLLKPEDQLDIPFIPGGGLSRRFLSSIPKNWTIPVSSLLMFAMDGDNRADAHLLASVVVKVLGLETSVQGWKQPNSWQQGLFGTPHDQVLYG